MESVLPIISHFEEQLYKQSSSSFGKWMAVDLHNHSPASHDFKGERSTALDDAVVHMKQSSIDIVMFTDHQTLPDRRFTEEVARRSGKSVLRGTEVNIFVDAWAKPQDKIDKQIFFHLLVGFDPEADEDPDYWFAHLMRECNIETRNIEGTNVQGFTDPVEKICEVLAQSGSIMIPAHLHTGKM